MVRSIDFQYSKDFDLLATASLRSESGNGKGRKSLPDGFEIWIGQGLKVGAPGIDEI